MIPMKVSHSIDSSLTTNYLSSVKMINHSFFLVSEHKVLFHHAPSKLLELDNS